MGEERVMRQLPEGTNQRVDGEMRSREKKRVQHENK